MTKSEIGQWVAIWTNLAVLVGVFLLVYELRQNAELARLEMTQTQISAFQQAEQSFFDLGLNQVWVKSFKEPENMTLAEIRAMDAYFAIHLNQMFRVYSLERAGLIESGETTRWMQGDFPFLFGNRFGKAWWDEFGQYWPTDFVAVAHPVVESVDDNELSARFGRLQRALGAD